MPRNELHPSIRISGHSETVRALDGAATAVSARKMVGINAEIGLKLSEFH
jgi:hypothetical protein